jgi:AcrR family transcriptional regulator
MSQPGQDRPSVLQAARDRARAEVTDQILTAARHHLATDGASGLSLRAIARELGVSSSAVYRYVASRDELLTRLMVAAYDALGDAAEDAEATVARDDLSGRWAAVCHAVRAWARAHPYEYALVYGTPVPGYTAVSATVAPAARIPTLLLEILADAVDRLEPVIPDDLPPQVRRALAPVRSLIPPAVPDALAQQGLMAWAALLGTVSLELFGQLHHLVGEEPGDRDAYFADCVRRWTTRVGIAPEPTTPARSSPTRTRERPQEVTI